MPREKIPHPPIAELKKAYASGYVADVAEHFNVSVPTARRWLAETQIQVRTRGRRLPGDPPGPVGTDPKTVQRLQAIVAEHPEYSNQKIADLLGNAITRQGVHAIRRGKRKAVQVAQAAPRRPKRRAVTAAELAAMEKGAAPKKRRGRPPKAKVQAEAPKRRGRPPKMQPAAQAAPKRRGRPPKAQAEAPKRRGRPPKAAPVAAPAQAPAATPTAA